ncbi:hypothetical protein DUI87_16758 [Hirundo rustica rustica]|uniref:Uncharacterized protein n=1 Tax=Hirundo rustica rustica TaxID=333673 RepID=A0A3M0K8C4_HIRRU|nr:hypothetical protein DUI87_16758 [Hirundo rustica rustica]
MCTQLFCKTSSTAVHSSTVLDHDNSSPRQLPCMIQSQQSDPAVSVCPRPPRQEERDDQASRSPAPVFLLGHQPPRCLLEKRHSWDGETRQRWYLESGKSESPSPYEGQCQLP